MTESSASNATGTVRVRATETGSLIALHIDQSELRFGGDALAATITSVCTDAAAAATERHRAALLRAGVASEVVDRVAPADTASALPRGPWTVRP